MDKYKRVLLSLVSFILVFGLVGCGTGKSGDSTTSGTVETSKVVEKKVTKPELKEYVEKVDEKVSELEKLYEDALKIKNDKIVIDDEKQRVYNYQSICAEVDQITSSAKQLQYKEIVTLHNSCINNYVINQGKTYVDILLFSQNEKWNTSDNYSKQDYDKIEKEVEDLKQLKNIYIQNRDKILNETIYQN